MREKKLDLVVVLLIAAILIIALAGCSKPEMINEGVDTFVGDLKLERADFLMSGDWISPNFAWILSFEGGLMVPIASHSDIKRSAILSFPVVIGEVYQIWKRPGSGGYRLRRVKDLDQ